jgi:predicted molibdopterin-dependent oxidoreductase YjgC
MISFEIKDEIALMPNAADLAQQRIVQRLVNSFQSAASKKHTSELTEEEASAVCMFSGVPYEIDLESGKMIFDPCRLDRDHGNWIAFH